jgi:coenzyme PQQ precursor peptide PqqA
MTKKTWNAPKVVEISAAMEINCYACAESAR